MTRQEPNSEGMEFQDPLENYDPPEYKDRLLEALCEHPVTAIRSRPFETIHDDLPIEAALKLLAGRDIACVLVVDAEDKLVGVFSDRDVQDKIALEYEALRNHPVSEVMSRPVYVTEEDTAAAAVGVMASTGYRHIPIVDAQEKVVGIVSPQRMAAFLERYFNRSPG